ncbi:protein COFACTOR ASSEMBLY OF COMPLEX C SUBUNIT B CCB3, chloroplastic [Camellia sinensis]|uniref:protein COFACTOR ASSEMBLY OF COMPLEX C SUBUNIT B CCB3, chloroplastic n=1 Tax=Camellia sinensis TaxID=4442 RepID=UPI001036E6EC|nr:protein COFACTOR ASSEMBLY OF COMPLEX C SUBUNIT B CCB3, chloroplastic [Camellia sinensis]
MENSGLLMSSRNIINPIPSKSISDFKDVKLRCNTFSFRNLPPSRFHFSLDKVKFPTRSRPSRGLWSKKQSTICCCIGVTTVPAPPIIELSASNATIAIVDTSHAAASEFMQRLVVVDLDPATAKLAIGFLGPFLSGFGFLFILRIVMSWYPKLPVEKLIKCVNYKFPKILYGTIPPLGGVDVTPVVWFGLISFMNEILVGPQGLLVLLSQQI